jgi:hypothetical protein
MALSMLVLIIPVFLLVGFYRYLGHETPPSIDTTEAYGAAQRAGQFQPLQVQNLPGGWRISSATFADGMLRLGVTAPDDGALQVVESAKPRDEVLTLAVGPGAQAADAAPGGWQKVSNTRPGERAIAQTSGPRTVVIVGQAKDEQLRQLAGTLTA